MKELRGDVTIYQCDGCLKEEESKSLPPGWFQIGKRCACSSDCFDRIHEMIDKERRSSLTT